MKVFFNPRRSQMKWAILKHKNKSLFAFQFAISAIQSLESPILYPTIKFICTRSLFFK